jgi:hypothetical protein
MSTVNNIPTKLRLPAQLPLDAKTTVATLSELETLGTNDNLAFTYYKGMLVYCTENDKFYQWRPVEEGDTGGTLASDFTYPNGIISEDGIDYSNAIYNFFEKVYLTPENVESFVNLYNVGNGSKIYKEGTRFDLKTISSPNIIIDETNPDELVLLLPSENRGIPAFIVNQDFIPTYNDFLNYYNNVYLVNGGTPLEVGETFAYRGEGTSAKPFTDTRVFTFGTPGLTPTTVQNTSISNALLAYVGTGTPLNPQFMNRNIIVQSSVSAYTLEESLNYSGLRLFLEETVNYTLDEKIVDMNDATKFDPINSNVIITIEEGTSFVLNEKNSGFRNDGNTVQTDNFSNGRLIQLKGQGTVFFPYSGADALDYSCFELDKNADSNGSLGNNNNGNICIDVECNVRSAFMPVVKIGGKSKIEFRNGVVFNALLGPNPNPLTRIFECKGGLIRFFGENILSISNGDFGGDTIDRAFNFIKVGSFESTLVMRGTQFQGFSKKWFVKENEGAYVNVDILNISSLFFSGQELFDVIEVDPVKWGVNFRNNILEQISVNFDKVDFTQGNTISSLNTIGNNVVEQLVALPYRRTVDNTTGTLLLPKYSKFVNTAGGSLDEFDWYIDIML